MDVIFETQKGGSFSIEISYFDTVLEIKEKIQKYRDIPISYQTLVFNGKVLEDDGNVDSCIILDNSRIRLIVAGPSRHHDKAEEQHSPISKKAQLLFILPTSKSQQLSLDLDLNDSIEQFFVNLMIANILEKVFLPVFSSLFSSLFICGWSGTLGMGLCLHPFVKRSAHISSSYARQ